MANQYKPQFDFSKFPAIWLVVIIAILVVMLIACVGTHGQTYELQRGKIENGKIKITETKRYPLARAFKEQSKLYKQLKPGEVLIGPSWVEKVSVEVKDVDVLTVHAEGFTDSEIETIKRALESWNANGERFVYQEDGQVKIRRQKLNVMALSVMQIQGDAVVSGTILIDPHVVDLKALESVVAHEMGHVLGLPDSLSKGSIMFHKSKGRNRDNGHVSPSATDLGLLAKSKSL